MKLARWPFDLEVHQPVQRDGRWNLALHERIHVADVPGDNRYEPERPRGIAPGQTAGNADLLAFAATRLQDGGRGLSSGGGSLHVRLLRMNGFPWLIH